MDVDADSTEKMTGRVRLKEDGTLDEDLPNLQECVYQYLSASLQGLCSNPDEGKRILHRGVVIPSEVCDKFLDYYQTCKGEIDDTFMWIFQNTRRTPLKYVHLRNSTITNEGLEVLLSHRLISLSMWYCDSINVNSRHKLAKFGENLRNLELGLNVKLLKYAEPIDNVPVDFQLNFPHLRRLVLNGVVMHQRLQFAHLQDLNYLDLTSCVLTNSTLESLSTLPNLQTLILFNVWPISNHLPIICQMKNLRTLDISIMSSTTGIGDYSSPDQNLELLVTSLLDLTHLDISGTNLAGNGVAQKGTTMQINQCQSDIPGLASRTQRPLQFLGLYQSDHWACKRHDIPAIEIAGDADEKQILTAAKYYYDRPLILTRILNDLYHLFRFESCVAIHTALDVVLSSMDRHLRFKHMQISGSATLFYIVKSREKAKIGTTLKNHIITTLLNGMQAHIADDTMLRNGYLTLTQFSMPIDVLFEYDRLIKILLHGVSKTEGFVQRIAIYLLNTMACQVDGRQKLSLGELGVITTMLNLIKERLSRFMFDDVMEVAWSTMWNVTDETAINCKRFLDGLGMDYFLKCLNTFPDKEELLRNMMGLLGNVAEVKWLRSNLMTTEFVQVFSELLDSKSDGIEVSYNAAGVLAHIASDGANAWTIQVPSRVEVLDRMVKAIELWNIKSERNINYRSFEPILSLLGCYDTPECQHWAVWALANLTEVYPNKYCPLVNKEKGVDYLRELVSHPKPYKKIKELAGTVITRCSTYEDKIPDLDG